LKNDSLVILFAPLKLIIKPFINKKSLIHNT
jgi:hypothetical protein